MFPRTKGYVVHRMRSVIQDGASELFLLEDGTWGDCSRAIGFESVLVAIDHCRKHKLQNVRIVMKFGSSEYDIVLPLGETQPASRGRLNSGQA